MKKTFAKVFLAGLLAAMSQYAAAGTTNLNTITPPLATTFGDSFTSQVGQIVDDFVFTLAPGASFSSIAATLDLGSLLGISDLQARLYLGSGPFVPGSTPLEQAWSSPVSAGPGVNGSVVVINPIALAANTYTLEVRGNVVGSAGGAYSGTLNFATLPVPEPETYALMLAGLGMLGWVASRRRKGGLTS